MKFEKVEGCGNHFILIDEVDLAHSQYNFSSSDIQAMCQPNFGIGADGILIIKSISEQYQSKKVNYEMVVYNADGSLAQMCGNGLRCVAQYLYQNHQPFLSQADTSEYIKTGSGVLEVLRSSSLSEDDPSLIGVKMGWPIIQETLKRNGRSFQVISLGNPHIVTFNYEDYANRERLSKEWSHLLKDGVNISFAQVLKNGSVRLDVHERGCGWTLACGTGACATVFQGFQQERFAVNDQVTVRLPGGTLLIDISPTGLVMWGPANTVFSGDYYLSST